jgi:hypothetical protein
MTLNGSNLLIDWGSGNTISSSALPRLSLADNLIYTVVANSETTGSGPRPSTTVDYSFAVIDASTGTIVGSPYFLSSNSFAGSYPNYLNTSSYKWNTLQMTGVISPTGVFYQGTAGGLFSVQRAEPPAAPPSTPTGLSATSGDGQATITFSPAASNGAEITNYEYSLNDGAFIVLSPAKPDSPITIAGLTNGTSYSITLRAINSVGSSAADSAAVVTTPVAPVPPAAATPVPTSPLWLLGIMVGLLSLVGIGKLRKA